MKKVSRKQRRLWQSNWRKRHPISDAWHNHKSNAKKRKIAVEWNFDEFRTWCLLTGYHILRSDGFQIHRRNDKGPYRSDRCECLPSEENRRLQAVEQKKAKWRRFRENLLARNGFVGLHSRYANSGATKQQKQNEHSNSHQGND